MQVATKTISEAHNGVQTKIQTKELCATPFEQTFECNVTALSESFNVDSWARSFSTQKFDNSSIEKLTLHFYLDNSSENTNLHVSTESVNTWKKLTEGITSKKNGNEKVFLYSKTFTKPVSVRQKYDSGFQYDNKINTGNFSVVIKTDRLQPETLNALRVNFLCAYNQSIAVIQLNFPRFDDVEKWLNQYDLEKGKDYFLVDTLNDQSETGSLQKLSDHIVVFKENQDQIQVINLI